MSGVKVGTWACTEHAMHGHVSSHGDPRGNSCWHKGADRTHWLCSWYMLLCALMHRLPPKAFTASFPCALKQAALPFSTRMPRSAPLCHRP